MWEGSGLNVGYWSEDCEKWYQNHIKKCIAGTAMLRNPAEWRHAMRFTRDVGRMVEKNNLLAAESFSCLQLKDTFQVDGEILEALETMH